MNISKIKPGLWYVVTLSSDDGTLEAGDHIKLNQDGTLTCREARGFIESQDIEKVLVGCQFDIDQSWIERRKKQLSKELENLNFLTSDS